MLTCWTRVDVVWNWPSWDLMGMSENMVLGSTESATVYHHLSIGGQCFSQTKPDINIFSISFLTPDFHWNSDFGWKTNQYCFCAPLYHIISAISKSRLLIKSPSEWWFNAERQGKVPKPRDCAEPAEDDALKKKWRVNPGILFFGFVYFYHILPYVIICYQIVALVGRDSCLTHFIILDYLE